MQEHFPALTFDLTTLSGAEVGCWASHLLAWQRVLQHAQCKAATVIEDDLTLDDDFAPAVAELEHELPCDLVYLGTSSRNISSRRIVFHGERAIHAPVGRILNTWGYVVARAWLLRFFAEPRLSIGIAIDEFLGGDATRAKPRIGVLRPPVVEEHPEFGLASQIEPYTFRFDRSRLFDRARRTFLRSRAGELYYSLYRWL
jgi:GR25 family glycosyltransferase involved in LPS biosynthesis